MASWEPPPLSGCLFADIISPTYGGDIDHQVLCSQANADTMRSYLWNRNQHIPPFLQKGKKIRMCWTFCYSNEKLTHLVYDKGRVTNSNIHQRQSVKPPGSSIQDLITAQIVMDKTHSLSVLSEGPREQLVSLITSFGSAFLLRPQNPYS